MPDHGYLANLIRQIADLLRGPYERVMLLMTDTVALIKERRCALIAGAVTGQNDASRARVWGCAQCSAIRNGGNRYEHTAVSVPAARPPRS